MVCVKEAGNNYLCGACINGSVSGTMQCQLVQNSPAGGGDSPNAQTPSGNVPGVANGTDMQLDGICSALASAPDKTTPTFQKMIESAQGLAAMKKALVTGKDTASCKGLGPTQYNLPSGTVKQALQNAMAPIVGPAKPNLLDNANQLLTAGVAAVTYAPDADGTQPITAPDATTWKAAWKAFEQGLKGQGQLQDQTQDQTSDQTSSPAQGPAQGQVASANSALATIGQQLQQLTTIRSTVQSDVVWLNGADATFTSNANVANAKDSQGPTMAKQMATYMGQYQGMVDNAQTSYNAVAGQMAAGKGIIPVFVKDMRDLHANTNKFLTGTGDSISVLPSSLGGNPPVNPPVGIKDYNTLVPQPTTTPTADQQTAATNVNSTRDFLAKQQYGSAPAGSAGDLNCVGPSCPGGLAQVSVADLQAINANLNNCPPAAAPGAATALVTPAMPVMTPIAGPVTAADASAQPMSQ